jgi:hypothetical protein
VTTDADACEAAALRELLTALAQQDYAFVTPTPETHRRVLARRPGAEACDLRDVFGWSLPFRPELLDRALLEALERGGLVAPEADGRLRVTVRVSSLGCHLFVHSAFPTEDSDAVFFGPDSYRFALLIEAVLGRAAKRTGGTIVDIGTGSGIGAVVAAGFRPGARLIGTDVNPRALRFAQVNAGVAGFTLRPCLSETLAPVDTPIDLALANPPYMIDDDARDYRDGGAQGIEVALRMTRDALGKLAADGTLILYTGVPILAGRDPLRPRLDEIAAEAGCRIAYRELDPDVFGEELAKPAYGDAERIAVVAAIFVRQAGG